MMLHHLTQLGALGCLPACYNREGGREIPPVNNGTCAFMSAPCLRENFENVWSVCRLLRWLSTPYFHTSSRFPSLRLPLLSSPQLFTLKVERLPPHPSFFDASRCSAVAKPRHESHRHHQHHNNTIVKFSACRHICGNPFAKFQRVRFTMIRCEKWNISYAAMSVPVCNHTGVVVFLFA